MSDSSSDTLAKSLADIQNQGKIQRYQTRSGLLNHRGYLLGEELRQILA